MQVRFQRERQVSCGNLGLLQVRFLGHHVPRQGSRCYPNIGAAIANIEAETPTRPPQGVTIPPMKGPHGNLTVTFAESEISSFPSVVSIPDIEFLSWVLRTQMFVETEISISPVPADPFAA